MKFKVLPLFVFSVYLLTSDSASAMSLHESITQGSYHFSSRLRYENVDDAVNKKANALTLGTKLGYSTKPYHGFSAQLEIEDSRVVFGVDRFAPESLGYAVVPDPEVTEVNKAFIQYSDGHFTAKVGRQAIIFDNSRFVGNLKFRQDEQVFDAAKFKYASDIAHITAAYIYKVEGALSRFDNRSQHILLNAQFRKVFDGRLSTYAYLLEDDVGSYKSNDTLGVRYHRSWNFTDSLKLNAGAEYASQRLNNADGDFDTDYLFLNVGGNLSGYQFSLSHEVLGSDGGRYAFQTPLATKHAFNGWSDKFLITPKNGLEDSAVSFSTQYSGVVLKAVYHVYQSNKNSIDYGKEFNFIASKKINKAVSIGSKYADYSADDFSRDTKKIWFWVEYTFAQH